ncbi:MAG TPA: transglutaminase domain-containing protein, partial [Arthrobacter sp.]
DTRATRRESAAVVADAFPGSGTTTTLLARRADASIFGAGQPSEDEVREYWTIVDGSLKEMTATVGFWRRQQARFSPRSLLADGRAALKLRSGGLGLASLKRPGSAAPQSGSAAPQPAEGRVESGPAAAPAGPSEPDESTVLRNPGRKNHPEP